MTQARPFRPTVFAAPLLLFLVSALGALWMGRGQMDDWLLFGLIVASVALFGLLARLPDRVVLDGRELAPLGDFWGSLPTALSLYFLLTNDWARWIGKLSWLDPVMRWFASWTVPSNYALNPNIAGGLIAAFLPLQLAALGLDSHGRGLRWLSAVAIAIALAGLLFSASRGAWLALGLVAGGWGLWKVSGRLAERVAAGWPRRACQLLLPTVAGLGLVALVLSPWAERLQAFVEADRAVIWRNSFDLATDYPFTGIGLGQFEMAYSSYVMLLHVGHTKHAHNLFLDLWLQLGAPGLVAFGWLLILAVRARPLRWRAAALATIFVILLHGLVDDAFFALGGYTAVLLFSPFAILARSAPAPLESPAAASIPRKRYWWAGVAGVVVVAIAGVALVPSLQAAFLANLGALVQSRVELRLYHWPEWPIQDELRRSPTVDLTPAIRYYQSALALDPSEVTANRRLGQIELSVGQYEAACRHLEAAYRVAPRQRATRQLLGECYAVTGEPAQAAKLWRTVDVSQGQLNLRQWWYEYLGNEQRLAWLKLAMNLARPGGEE